jgi:hypothetical protein
MENVDQLLDKVTALLGRRDLSQTEFAAWFGGAADGGPAGDGLFPLSDSTGFTRMVPSPARQMADVGAGGTISLEGWLKLNVVTAAEITPATTQIILQTAPGKPPKRGSPYLIAPRKTVDLDVLPPSEFAEWMSCLSSTGLERKIAVNALTRSFGDIIDPTRPPYNVRFDAQKMKGITITNGSNLIYAEFATTNGSQPGKFTQADVGKLAVVSNYGPDNGIEGFIGQVDPDGKRCRLFTDLTFATPLKASSTRQFQEMIWGTDCTAGMQAAVDAAEPHAYEGLGQVVALGGFTMIRRLRFGNVSIVGLSTTSCGFYQLANKNAQDPWIAAKSTGGLYAGGSKPHHFTLRNMTLYAQRYTVPYTSFRRALEITGATFDNTFTGAPYAVLEGIDIYESRYDGFFGDGVFAGFMKDFRVFFSEQCGMRVGFFDLNGLNWHAEGNGWTGIYSTMVGANINLVRCSYNGANASAGNGHQHGSNWTEAGNGNTGTNFRLQECWGHSMCITDLDTNGYRNGAGNGNAFYLGTFDDTANTSSMLKPDGSHYADPTNLPDIRAMVMLYKTLPQDNYTSCRDNTVNLTTGSPQVRTTNYATNGVGVIGYARNNEITLRTPKLTNTPADWYAGAATDRPALARGPWTAKNIGADTIGSLGNVVSVNRQIAP